MQYALYTRYFLWWKGVVDDLPCVLPNPVTQQSRCPSNSSYLVDRQTGITQSLSYRMGVFNFIIARSWSLFPNWYFSCWNLKKSYTCTSMFHCSMEWPREPYPTIVLLVCIVFNMSTQKPDWVKLFYTNGLRKPGFMSFFLFEEVFGFWLFLNYYWELWTVYAFTYLEDHETWFKSPGFTTFNN
jgi:hypothetical protein